MTEHVIVGMSGVVDSAVSAWLLLEQGLRVSGLFMVNWTDDESGYCTAAEDFQSARTVCDELDIPLHRADFSADYRDRVFRRFLDDYAAGRTPNPDVLCNREVKFGPFRDHALRLGADAIATGHYARTDGASDAPRLLRARDTDKDQSYFLCTLKSDMLRQVRFPVGDLPKREVRRLAERAGLPNHRRRDSTGICFIGERPMREFLSRYLDDAPGPILDDHGASVGQHPGLMHFTLGQRRGLGIGGRRGGREAPWYVIAKDPDTRTLVVSQDRDHPRLYASALRTRPFHWIRDPRGLAGAALEARIRHRQAPQRCQVATLDDDGVHVTFESPQRAITAGQVCALYDGEECLGGAEIDSAITS